MDLIPPEIVKTVLNYCDNRTRRIARLACRTWFNWIDYRYFTLYLTKKWEWPQIADRFASYSKPISLNFRKNIMNYMGDFTEHLLRLTSLTALEFEELDRYETDLETHWFKLTALPNLQSVRVDSYEYNVPIDPILSLSHLTSFKQYFTGEPCDNNKLQRAVRQWTNLQSCTIQQENDIDVDLWDSYNTKLTRLELYLPDVPERLLRQLGNIVYLDITINNYEPRRLSLKTLTALENLVLNGIQLEDLTSTRLTRLVLVSAEEHCIERAAHNLAELKIFQLDMETDVATDPIDPPRSYSYQWLTALTSLERLDINPIKDDGLLFISTSLTSLKIDARLKDLNHLSRFGSLKNLSMEVSVPVSDLSVLSVLTGLEDLRVYLRSKVRPNEFLLFSSLTNLTRLDLNGAPGNISNLPNLAHLQLRYAQNCHYSGFEGLPKLTALEVGAHRSPIDPSNQYYYTVVSNLTTLRTLALHQRPAQYNCKYFSMLTGLHILTLACISEDDYDPLSALTQLTYLRIFNAPNSEKIINLPLSLQTLYLDVKNADGGREDVSKLLVEKFPNLYTYYKF